MTINLISNEFSLHHTQVEWDLLTTIITQFAYFETNKKNLISNNYLSRSSELEEEFLKIKNFSITVKDDHVKKLYELFNKLPADDTLDKFISYVSKQGTLKFNELNKIAILAESGILIKKSFSGLNIDEIKVIQDLDFTEFQRKFLKEFRHLVDESGEVHFDRHPELSELTKRLRELEERVRRTVQEWINTPANQKVLQFNSYDIHYDRFVVPVRSDSYRSDLGLIVSRSDSGQTLFVEPFEIRDQCNKRMELIAKIDELINHLAMKFSNTLALHTSLLTLIQEQLIKLDFYIAKCDFIFQYNLNCPSLRAKPGFKLVNIFHPLLKNPIKNSVDCNEKTHGIVISGPNTGGKTVFLKSVVLSYLLFQHGFFVPASEAEMYPYEGLFYFGNDLQDLKVGLSSFSGEVKNYIDLLENILPSNLILIDEIFNSTSSDEASALSMAYFDELHKKGICHIIVSTHHQMFKTLVHQDNNYLSCHVGFDTKAMKPTYKIQWGTPGSSMAIDIFRILSQNHPEVSEVPDRALSHLSSKNISYESLLQRVSQKQIELDQLLNSNRQKEVDLKNQKGAMEGVLNLKLKDELARAQQELDKILNEARQIVEEARRSEITKLKKIDLKAHQLKAEIRQLTGAPVEVEEHRISDLDIRSIKPGDIVYSLAMKKDFLVHQVDIRKNEVIIVKGPIKINVPLESLALSNKKQSTPKVSVNFQRNNHSQVEIDVRGLRLSEFQSKVESTLGDLLAGDIPYLSVIHGHGDGILKNWLREYLKRSKDFIMLNTESGNDGETKIGLK